MLHRPVDTNAPELAASWRLVLDRLRPHVDESTFELWIEPLHPVDLASGVLVLAGPAHLVRWARDRYSGLIGSVATEAGVASSVVWIEATDEQLAAPPSSLHDRGPGHVGTPGVGERPPEPLRVGDPIDAGLTFSSFVIGHSNRVAHGACLQVAELPGTTFNPLLLCGPPGTGKTHLLHAIANYVADTSPELRIHMCTSEGFVTDFTGALRSKRISDFKSHVRSVDLLLVDDVQFLAGKDRTEEEFFHTFNALQRAGAQLVLTSDQPPHELGLLSERLRARFASGLVVELDRPDDALRRTYVARRAAEELHEPSARAQLGHLADRVTDGIRTLEGAILSTLALSSISGREVDQALVDDVVRRLYPQTRRAPERPTIRRVQDVVCQSFDLDHETLVGKSRAAAISWPRQIAMYLARQHTEASLPTIARAFNRRDHTTVMHAIGRVTEQIERDEAVHSRIQSLVDDLR